MAVYGLTMTQNALYWPPGTADGYGGFDDGDPEQVKTRWENKSVLFMDANGEEMQSSAVVYCNAEVRDGGHLALSSHDPATTSDSVLGTVRALAREIRGVNKSPSVDGETILVKVFL